MWYTDAAGVALIPMYTNTIARCTCLMYAADFTVSTAYSAYGLLMEPRPKQRRAQAGGSGLKAAELERLSHAAGQHAARCAITWFAAAVGAAAVAALAPRESAGRWAGIGHIVVDVVVSNGVVFLLLTESRSSGAGAAPSSTA